MSGRATRSYSLCLLILLPLRIAVGSDPIALLDEQYMTESIGIVKEGVGGAELREFYESWLSDFLVAIEEQPDSPLLDLAVSRAIGLANSTTRYDLSLDLLDQLLAREDTLSGQMSLLYDKGEVARSAYDVTRDVAYARQAIEYFSTLEQMVGKHYPTSDAHGAQLALGLARMARLMRDALEDHERAAEYNVRSNNVLERLGLKERAGLGAVWSVLRESTLADAAVEFARSGRPEQTRKMLGRLNKLEEREQPMGLYVLAVLGATESPVGELAQIADSWYVDEGAGDPFAPHVALATGGRLLHSGETELQIQAAHWFERLLADHGDRLLDDPRKKGIVRNTLRSLAEAYDVLGRDDDAASTREQLRAIDHEVDEVRTEHDPLAQPVWEPVDELAELREPDTSPGSGTSDEGSSLIDASEEATPVDEPPPGAGSTSTVIPEEATAASEKPAPSIAVVKPTDGQKSTSGTTPYQPTENQTLPLAKSATPVHEALPDESPDDEMYSGDADATLVEPVARQGVNWTHVAGAVVAAVLIGVLLLPRTKAA